jgi:hypothetical protein
MNFIYICSPISNPSNNYIKIFQEWIEELNVFNNENSRIFWFIQSDFKNNDDIIEFINLQNTKNYCEFFKEIVAITTNHDSNNNSKYIFWLPNDWVLVNKGINLQNIIQNFVINKSFFSFCKKSNIWELSPFIINYNLWISLFYNPIINNNSNNPDYKYLIASNLIKNICKLNRISNITIFKNRIDNEDKYICNNYFCYEGVEDVDDYIIMENYVFIDDIKEKFNNKLVIINYNDNICLSYERIMRENEMKNKLYINDNYNVNNLKIGKNNILFLCDKNEIFNNIKILNLVSELNNFYNIVFWGINWKNYNDNISVDENIDKLKIKVSHIFLFGIMNNIKIKTKISKIMMYNEIPDNEKLIREINNICPNLVLLLDLPNINIDLKKIECYTKIINVQCADDINIELKKKSIRIFILGDEIRNSKDKSKFDILKDEFVQFSQLNITLDPNQANIIWLLNPSLLHKVNREILEKKFVITTIYNVENFDDITNKYHVVNEKIKSELEKITTKKIVVKNFWINQNNFYKIQNTERLKEKYDLGNNYHIGLFDRESSAENSYNYFDEVKIIQKINKEKDKKIMVIITGKNQTELIEQLTKLKIKYKHFENLEIFEINELYNCIDLYVISNKKIGESRAFMECALAKVPINLTENIDVAYNNVNKYQIKNYLNEFISSVFDN